MIEPKMYTFEEFPACELAPEGMKVMKADHTPQFAMLGLHEKYAEKDGMDLHLQIIMPPMEREEMSGKEKKFPLIVFIQGSGWMQQNLGEKVHGLCEFATRGFVVAIVEYRPSFVSPFPAQVKDAKTAVRCMKGSSLFLLIGSVLFGVLRTVWRMDKMLMKFVLTGG